MKHKAFERFSAESIDHLLIAFAQALKQIPRAKLVVVGEGDYRGNLQGLAGELKIEDKIEFTGFVDQAEKVRRLQGAWVAVCPSLKEGWA